MFRFVFVNVRAFADVATRRAGRERRDLALAMVAPIGLLLLPVLWILLVWLAYGGLFVAVGVTPMTAALRLSGSSLLTLGFTPPSGSLQTLLTFSEATFGLGLLTLLIAYLPTMYSAFSAREAEVAMLEVRAGDPPSGVELLERYRRINRDAELPDLFDQWEAWFAVLDETHTSLPALPLFRSPNADRSCRCGRRPRRRLAVPDGGRPRTGPLRQPVHPGRLHDVAPHLRPVRDPVRLRPGPRRPDLAGTGRVRGGRRPPCGGGLPDGRRPGSCVARVRRVARELRRATALARRTARRALRAVDRGPLAIARAPDVGSSHRRPTSSSEPTRTDDGASSPLGSRHRPTPGRCS